MRNKILYALGILVMVLLARDLYLIARFPEEMQQGAIFKIIFFHVPMALTSMMCSAVALITSIAFLITKNFKYDAISVAVSDQAQPDIRASLQCGQRHPTLRLRRDEDFAFAVVDDVSDLFRS